LTLPQSAVLLRDGFSYVLRVGPDSKVSELKVKAGRRVGDRVEILDGLPADARVVASGGGFLGDGDTVRVVDAPVKSALAGASGAPTKQ
jgi:HlyD family secretion protein